MHVTIPMNLVALWMDQVSGSFSFYKVVKEHSSKAEEIINGGYAPYSTAESLKPAEGEGQDPAAVEVHKWLFEEERNQGDIKIVVSADQKTVYAYYYDSSKPAWFNAVRDEIISENFNNWNASLESNNPGYTINAGLVKYLIYKS